MLSEHSKECSLAQLAICNEFTLSFLSHRRITRLSKQIAIVSDFKILAVIPLNGHFPYLNCNSHPNFSLFPYLQNVNLWLACFSVCRLCIICEFVTMNCLTFARLSAHCYIPTSLSNDCQLKKIA